MSNVKIVWDSASWMHVFKTSPEIREGLNEHIKEAERRNCAELNLAAHANFKPEHAYKGTIKVLDKTMVAKLTAQSKGARIAGAAHGLPHW